MRNSWTNTSTVCSMVDDQSCWENNSITILAFKQQPDQKATCGSAMGRKETSWEKGERDENILIQRSKSSKRAMVEVSEQITKPWKFLFP